MFKVQLKICLLTLVCNDVIVVCGSFILLVVDKPHITALVPSTLTEHFE